MDWGLIVEVLPALVANATPVLLGGGPLIDGGMKFWDGKPLLGAHKTWQGLIAGIIAGVICGGILSLWEQRFLIIGLLQGIGAMLGDLLGSFVKRRLGFQPGRWVPFLDELPFLYGAMLLSAPLLNGALWDPYRLLVLSGVVLLLHDITNGILGRLR